MKILFIQKEGGIFGAEQFHLRTIPALLQRGVSLSFLRLYTHYQLGKDSPFLAKLGEMGVPVHQVNIGRFPGWRDIYAVHRIIKEGKFDLVHTHLIHGDLYGALVKRFFQPSLRLVSTKHGYEEWYNNAHGFDPAFRKKNLYWRISRFTEQQVNASFAISDGLHRFFVDSGISQAHKMQRIHYGFDFSDQQEVTPATRTGQPQLVIAGRLVGFKGHRYALEAVALLKHRYPNIHLNIIGIGELEAELKAMVERLQLESHVTFLGYRSDVAAFMKGADVILIPSIAEGFGVVTLEAIQQQRPIAAFDVPAGNEILPPSYHSLLVQPFEVAAYAERIAQLYEQPQMATPPLQQTLQRMHSYFTIDRMVDEIMAFYQKVLQA